MARTPRPRKMKLVDIEICFERLAKVLPEPKTELDYRDPYTLLVAVVLSAQATDVGVNRATKGLYAAADTPQAMVELGVDGIAHHIRTIGLFNTKAKNVHRLSEILIESHGGVVPDDREALQALPGVGHGAGQDPGCGRGRTGAPRSRKLEEGRPPLADPSREVSVQGAQAGMLALQHFRILPFQGQDPGRGLIRRRGTAVSRPSRVPQAHGDRPGHRQRPR